MTLQDSSTPAHHHQDQYIDITNESFKTRLIHADLIPTEKIPHVHLAESPTGLGHCKNAELVAMAL